MEDSSFIMVRLILLLNMLALTWAVTPDNVSSRLVVHVSVLDPFTTLSMFVPNRPWNRLASPMYYTQISVDFPQLHVKEDPGKSELAI
jgi:hypothetical protein